MAKINASATKLSKTFGLMMGGSPKIQGFLLVP
jgi:hypothetical protein